MLRFSRAEFKLNQTIRIRFLPDSCLDVLAVRFSVVATPSLTHLTKMSLLRITTLVFPPAILNKEVNTISPVLIILSITNTRNLNDGQLNPYSKVVALFYYNSTLATKVPPRVSCF